MQGSLGLEIFTSREFSKCDQQSLDTRSETVALGFMVNAVHEMRQRYWSGHQNACDLVWRLIYLDVK
jgi:hypothetical protein